MSPPDSPATAAVQSRPVASASPLVALRNGTYRTMWLAQLVASFGNLVQGVGAAWLMTELVGSPDWVAAVQAAVTLPMVMLAMVGGAVADLWDRRVAMLAAQAWMLTTATVLALMTGLGHMTPVILLVMTFALGCGQAFMNPAWQASISQLVPRVDLPAAIALGSMGFNFARTVGPALGGFIVATVGAEGAFMFNALSFLGVILALVFWERQNAKPSLPREQLFYAIVTGLRYVSAAPGIRAVMARSFGFNLFSGGLLALLPLVAKEQLAGGPFTYGLLLGAFGAGGVIGGVFSVQLRNNAGTEKLLVGSTVIYALATAVVGISPWIVLDMAVLMAGGASWLMCNSSINFTVQMLAPNWVKARTLSIYQTSMFGGTMVGSWLWGHVATASSVPYALVAAGFFGLVTPVLALRFRAPSVENVDLTPADLGPMPAAALELTPGSGPLLISIEYEIAAERVAQFIAAMREVRRIRRRDGAVGWRLYQDVVNPRQWTESYELPTWTDLLRLRERRLAADVLAIGKARDCHAGAAPPVIRRMLMQAPAHRISRTPAP